MHLDRIRKWRKARIILGHAVEKYSVKSLQPHRWLSNHLYTAVFYNDIFHHTFLLERLEPVQQRYVPSCTISMLSTKLTQSWIGNYNLNSIYGSMKKIQLNGYISKTDHSKQSVWLSGGINLSKGDYSDSSYSDSVFKFPMKLVFQEDPVLPCWKLYSYQTISTLSLRPIYFVNLREKD